VYSPTDLLYTQRCANATNILYTQHFLLKIRNSKILSFCYAHKRPSPFFLYIPTKNPLFNDKVWTYYWLLVSKWVKSQKTENIRPTHKPRCRASAKISFIIAIQPFHWCRQNAQKNITITVSVRVSAMVRVNLVLLFCITVSVRVSVTVRVSLVLFVSSNAFGASSVAICRHCVYKILVAFAQRCVYNKFCCILHNVVYIRYSLHMHNVVWSVVYIINLLQTAQRCVYRY